LTILQFLLFDQTNAALVSRRDFFQKHYKILWSQLKRRTKRDDRWNEVKRCCWATFDCLLVCIRTSDTKKRLTIASPTSCPNTCDSICAHFEETGYVMLLISRAGASMKAQMTCSCERVLGCPVKTDGW